VQKSCGISCATLQPPRTFPISILTLPGSSSSSSSSSSTAFIIVASRGSNVLPLTQKSIKINRYYKLINSGSSSLQNQRIFLRPTTSQLLMTSFRRKIPLQHTNSILTTFYSSFVLCSHRLYLLYLNLMHIHVYTCIHRQTQTCTNYISHFLV
jgi:hypothetical protein